MDDRVTVAMIEKMMSVIKDNGLYAFPIHSVVGKECACGKPLCESKGKHPKIPFSWKIIASRDEERVRGWFSKIDTINMAVATGRKATNGKYLVVVDVDKSEHEILKILPPTFGYRTGGGGSHLWYWTDIPVKNSVSLIATKVDIRGTNGYVVVPPSKHVSGRDYEILGDSLEIADIPAEITELLKRAYIEQKKSKKKARKQGEASPMVKSWAAVSVADIRHHIASGKKIPDGVRNATLHRLLCSDRAKGVFEYDELVELAKKYRKSFVKPHTFFLEEMYRVCASVMKYPAYNNAHEHVNESYVRWLTKHGCQSREDLLNKLQQHDTEWFSSLKPSTVGVSLDFLIKERKKFLESCGLDRISSYKPALLGKKLRELGFQRKRTAQNNLWLISVNSHAPVCYPGPMNNPEQEVVSEQTTTENPQVPVPEAQAKNQEKPEVTEHKVQVKRKEHPEAWKYPNISNTENLKGVQIYLKSLSKEEMSASINGAFVKDEAATRALYDEMMVGDVVGIDFSKYTVRGKEEGVLSLTLIPRKGMRQTEDPRQCSLAELDFALQTGFANILYRDGKPYGVSETMEVTLKVEKYHNHKHNEESKE